MSDTRKHDRARLQRQGGNLSSPGFDGRRYGNKRKAVAALKIKDRRRTKRAARQGLEGFEGPIKRKHIISQ